jgi:hypothetical protein
VGRLGERESECNFYVKERRGKGVNMAEPERNQAGAVLVVAGDGTGQQPHPL